MTMSQLRQLQSTIKLGVLAGLAGGFAEILWIWSYTALVGGDATRIAKGVGAAVGVETTAPVAFGIAIHMILSMALGIFLALVLRPLFEHLSGKVSRYTIVLAALTLVWAINFLLVLPQISPTFVQTVPYEVSLMSKLLFGLGAAAMLNLRLGRTRASAAVTNLGCDIQSGKSFS